jgi:hypothetical protein
VSAKFTKGPWVARQEFANRWRIEVPREGHVPISVGLACTTVLEVGCSNEDTAANAHLIASAPELYGALEGVLWGLEAYVKLVHPDDDGSATPKSAIGKARAALAKARGEQP